MDAIRGMDDEALKKYLDHEGDIYSVKNLCAKNQKGYLKETFALKLKQKLHGLGGETSSISSFPRKGSDEKKKQKSTRKIFIDSKDTEGIEINKKKSKRIPKKKTIPETTESQSDSDFDLEEYLSMEKKVKKSSSEDSSVINSHNVLKQVQEDPTIPIIEINYFEDVPSYEVPPHTLLEVNSEDFITAEVISNLISELKFIQEKINYEKTTIINVCRDNTVAGIGRALKRSSFSPYNELDVVFVDLEDTPEGAIDGGGPTRELWRLALQELKCSNIFTGAENSRNIVYNLSYLEKRKYYEAGQIISLALVHGGPGPSFFSKTLFSFIAYGSECVFPNLEDIGDSEYLTEISAVAASTNLEDLRIAISKSSILLEIGISPLITTFD
ncbi:hypothetical protein JTB14_009401 [Gonioctena quinquepunctata]|nr:hypothetical protein JTB14_009401 [Gonioctena quinquepunctata]